VEKDVNSVTDGLMHSGGLRLVIERFTGTPGEGRVALINESKAPVRLWRAGSQWGDVVLSFRAQHLKTTIHVVRRPQIYTYNVRSAVLVSVGANYYWSFDFGDGTWEADVPFRQWVCSGARLTALYQVDADPDSLAHDVWVGSLQSEPIDWQT
jgi:hypothetical protein